MWSSITDSHQTIPKTYRFPRIQKHGISLRPVIYGIGTAAVTSLNLKPRCYPHLGTIRNSHINDLPHKINYISMENKSLTSIEVKSSYTNNFGLNV